MSYLAKFLIQYRNGALVTKDIMKDHFSKLSDGDYIIAIKKKSDRITSTRYKYYFDCVLSVSLPFLSRILGWRNPMTGEFIPVSDTGTLHEWFKLKYNPRILIDPNNGSAVKVSAPTKDMSDREFINQFLEPILSELIGDFFLDIPTYDDWKESRKDGSWEKLKATYIHNNDTVTTR